MQNRRFTRSFQHQRFAVDWHSVARPLIGRFIVECNNQNKTLNIHRSDISATLSQRLSVRVQTLFEVSGDSDAKSVGKNCSAVVCVLTRENDFGIPHLLQEPGCLYQ